MNEVSSLAFGMVFDGLNRRGIPSERLVEGLPVSLDDLRGFRKRVDWDLFVRLNERLEELCGGPGGLFQLGHDQFQRSSTFGFMRQVARVFRRPRDLYWMGTTWFGRSLFSIVEGEFRDLPDKRIEEIIRIPEGYRDCPQLFHVMHGSLTSAPNLIRFPDAQVEMELAPRQATYLITPPQREAFQRPRISKLTSRFAAWDLIEALSKQQDEFKESIQELNSSRDDFVEQLALVREIGHELSRQVGLDEVTRTLATHFEKHLPEWRVALWHQPLDAGKEVLLFAAPGASDRPPRSYPLRTARGVVGRLDVWPSDAQAESMADSRRGELLEGLVPWIALALDGARSHAALRNSAIGPLS
jgi:hypothetical protein